MRCVLITPFGMPVEPEVNRNFAMVSGVTRACAASAASGAASSVENSVAPFAIARDDDLDIGRHDRLDGARILRASQANTRPGVSRLTMCRSLPKSDEISE